MCSGCLCFMPSRSALTPCCRCGLGRNIRSLPKRYCRARQVRRTSRSRWGGAGGADFSWEGARTTFRAGYVQQTTDGGGLAEAVVLQEFRGEVHRRLTTRWTLTADLARSLDDPLHATSGISPYQTWSGGGGFEYAFTDRWMMRLRYDREHLYTKTIPSLSPTNRNLVLISFGYSFSRPLGR